MKLVLDIKGETDLQMLLMLLKRLKISYVIPEKTVGTDQNGARLQKNYDAEAIQNMIAGIQQRKVFAEITDPVEWQRQLRNEWE
jgi:hypothetical protein